ncbi:MAG: TetR/AcrR family transcriptional regulator [Bacteroidota bacterium]
MPKKTFLNLKTDKKEYFIRAALEEFSQNSYESASVNQLAKALGIAKGSIYQYFEDKKDLYLYLLTYCNQKKQEKLAPILQERYPDFFTLFFKMYETGLAYDLSHPLRSSFLTQVSRERHVPGLGDLPLRTLQQSTAYFKQRIIREQEKGHIRADINSELMAFVLVQLGQSLPDFFRLSKGDPENETYSAQAEEISNFMKDLVELLHNGMGVPPASDSP